MIVSGVRDGRSMLPPSSLLLDPILALKVFTQKNTCYFFSYFIGLLLLLLSRFTGVRLLCDPIDGSPPGSPIAGILQAGTLEWVAISFSNA